MKNLRFYFIIFLFILVIFETFSSFVVKIKKENLKGNLKSFVNDLNPEIIKKYSKYIPYTREKKGFDEDFRHITYSKNNYFFSIINNFNKRNKANILIQGDSWALTAIEKENYHYLKKFSKNNKIGLINSGIGSYSLSPMTIQLHILKKEFSIEPEIILAIIDQTDLGDELYRYKETHNGPFLENLSQYDFKFKKKEIDNFNKKNLSTIKLMKYFYNYFRYVKNKYNHDNIKTLKLIYKKQKAELFKIPFVLYPLNYGLTKDEKSIIKKRFDNYLSIAFKNKKLKKIYFISHPHLNHLTDKKYKENISNIIEEIIIESVHKNKIKHINFNNKNNIKDKNLFMKNDKFSHLTKDAYSNYFLPNILKKIEF